MILSRIFTYAAELNPSEKIGVYKAILEKQGIPTFVKRKDWLQRLLNN